MKQTVEHSVYGKIEFEESQISGKKTVSINGMPLRSVKKNEFILKTDEGDITCIISGYFLTGATINIKGDVIRLTQRLAWYEILLAVIIPIFIIIWGNSPALFTVVPVIRGAIGCLIGCAFGIFCLLFMKKQRGILAKLLVWIISLALAFGIGALLGFVIYVALLSLIL